MNDVSSCPIALCSLTCSASAAPGAGQFATTSRRAVVTVGSLSIGIDDARGTDVDAVVTALEVVAVAP